MTRSLMDSLRLIEPSKIDKDRCSLRNWFTSDEAYFTKFLSDLRLKIKILDMMQHEIWLKYSHGYPKPNLNFQQYIPKIDRALEGIASSYSNVSRWNRSYCKMIRISNVIPALDEFYPFLYEDVITFCGLQHHVTDLYWTYHRDGISEWCAASFFYEDDFITLALNKGYLEKEPPCS